MHFLTAFGCSFVPQTWIFSLDFTTYLLIYLLANSHIAHVLSTVIMDLDFIYINLNNFHNILLSGVLFIIGDKMDAYRSYKLPSYFRARRLQLKAQLLE